MGVTDLADYVPTLRNSCKRLGAAQDGWRHGNGMGPCRAVHIWGRTAEAVQ